MSKFRKICEKLPAWIFTVLVVALILWLTLAPHPIGDEELPLFPGADKLVHAIMFGTLSAVLLFDYSRFHHWRNVSWPVGIAFAALSAIFGICIEFLQESMQLGRSFEWLDMLADTAGAFLAMLLWKLIETTRPSAQ